MTPRRFAILACVGALVLAAGAATTVGLSQRFGEHSGRAGKGAHASRLLSASGSGRAQFWRAAWHDFLRDPVAGVGAGGWVRTWQRDGDARVASPGAHTLYLEVMGEVGIVGSVLLLLFLLFPVVGAVRARGDPIVATAFGCYLAFLTHAAFDYDWEVPVVTCAALVAAGCLVEGRDVPVAPLPRPVRAAVITAGAALAAVACALYVGMDALASAETQLARGNNAAAASSASLARTWQPWSPAPLLVLAASEMRLGHRSAALKDMRQPPGSTPTDPEAWAAVAASVTGLRAISARSHVPLRSPRSHTTSRTVCQRPPGCAAKLRRRALTSAARRHPVVRPVASCGPKRLPGDAPRNATPKPSPGHQCLSGCSRKNNRRRPVSSAYRASSSDCITLSLMITPARASLGSTARNLAASWAGE